MNYGEEENTKDDSKKEHTSEGLAVYNMMRSPDGRTFAWDWLQSCGVFENIFNKDAIEHAYNAGKRAAGLDMDRKIRDNQPVYYLKMLEENQNG